MTSTYKLELQSARAFGNGDWARVIELEREALTIDRNSPYRYAMIGLAYENSKNIEGAKENYGLAIALDEQCNEALEGLARVYANEDNQDLAYHYVIRGLNMPQRYDYKVPNVVKLVISIIVKLFRPSKPYRKIRNEVNGMDQTRSKWIKWALKYKEWYESKYQKPNNEPLH